MIAYSIAVCLLLTSRTLIRPSIFVYAAEDAATPGLHHGSDSLVSPALSQESTYIQDAPAEGNNGGYIPDFAYFGRSLLGRQAEEVGKLKNDEKLEADINPDSTVFFVFEKSAIPTKRGDEASVEALDASGTENTPGMDAIEAGSSESGEADGRLSPRQARKRIWISANTCRQPLPRGDKSLKNGPQLRLYVSTSVDNQKPGPDSTNNLVTNSTGIEFNSGFASVEVNTTSDVYIGVHAPKLDGDWFGSWHFEIAASTERSYHSHDDKDPFLYMVDTDSESTLFITYNLTDSDKQEDVEKWNKESHFSMYAFPTGGRSPVTGMENSVCALEQKYNTTSNVTVLSKITTKFGSGFPKRQFDVHGLDNNQTYDGYLIVLGDPDMPDLPGGRKVGAGGMVFKQFQWTTKVDDSCQVLTDLDFCDSVAYAVPSSLKFKFDDDKLRALYDTQAKQYYQNFSNSLDQVACDAPATSKYSLARTCDDCRRDYKNWLCSVLIPRCEDWTAPDRWLQMRNVNSPIGNINNETTDNVDPAVRERFGYSKSRNPMIDTDIQPGPYKEVLPCIDMCFDIVRSCPAQLEFACPEQPARAVSYGERDPSGNQLWCNFPGAVVKLTVPSAAGRVDAGQMSMMLAVVLTLAFLFME